MPDIMTEQEFELQQEAINKDRKLNLNITYPYDPDYEYTTRLERINNDALATLTILVASSRPEDKEIMMQLIKTIIK